MKKRKSIFFFLALIMILSFAACADNSSGRRIATGREHSKVQAVSHKEQADTEEPQEEPKEQAEEDLFIVLAMKTKGSILRVYDIKKDRQEDYIYSDATSFMDKYGTYISSSQMLPGRIVSLEISQKTGDLITVRISDEAWEYDGVKRFSIQESDNIFTIADTKYYYENDLHVFSEEEVIKLSDIGENDILRVQGIGKKILTISVTTGHGLIQLTNTELFEGGWLNLSAKTYLKITKDMQIEAAEGTYLLSVANDGYGDTKEITVNRGETTVVDLDELKGEGPKFCTVTFEVGVESAVMTLDGQIIDYTQPQQIRYGIHRLEIVAEGYETWSKRLYVNSEEATIQVAMTSDGTSAASDNTEKSSEKSSEKKDEKDKTDNMGQTNNEDAGKAGSLAGSAAGSKAGSVAGTEQKTNNNNSNNTNKSDSSKKNSSSEDKDTEKSSERSSDSRSTQDYLKTLSDIIDTLTGGSSGSN